MVNILTIERLDKEDTIMKTIGVLGSGTMGAGIMQVCAMAGYNVVQRSRRQTSVDGGRATVEKNLSRMVAKEKITQADMDAAMARIKGSTDLSSIAEADFVIEAATEDMEAKKALFKELDELCKPEAIIATNTSALSITEIAASTNRPDKIIGMHFFNPVPAMKLVEVVKGLATSDETRQAVLDLCKDFGKTPVDVEEAPGFVVNRILIPMVNEGIGILADGVADAEGIDTAMKLGANHPMGPLALGDLIGLDVCLAIMETLYREFGDTKYRPHPLLRKMVRANKLGRKTGVGFFDYSK